MAAAAGAGALLFAAGGFHQIPTVILAGWAVLTAAALSAAARVDADTVQSVALAASLVILGAALSVPDMTLWPLALELSVLFGVILEKMCPDKTREGVELTRSLGLVESQLLMTGAAPPSRYRGIAYVFGQGGALALGAAIGRAVERGAFAPRERMHRHGALHNEQQETDAGGTGGGGSAGGGGRGR